MTTLETLKAARELIAIEDHWCKHDYALDGGDVKVGPNSYKAYEFCAVGALCRATKKGPDRVQLTDAYEALSSVVPNGWITDFNDAHTHAEVLAAFDAAIAKAELPTHPKGDAE